MALFLNLQTVFLLALMHFSTCRSKESSKNLEYPVQSVNVSIHSEEKCLNIKWTVHQHAYKLNLKMIFQIDIRKTIVSNPAEIRNYTTVLKPDETLQWCWHSVLPLECTPHFVRIRSMVDDERFPESRIWSAWSQWKLSEGQDSSGKFLIFPADTFYAEEGSNVTFCCISEADNEEVIFFYDRETIQGIRLSPRTTMYKVNDISFLKKSGTNAFCKRNSSSANNSISGVVLLIGGVLEEPKDFSCETRDLKTLNCTWDPGRDTLLPKYLPNYYSLFEWFSQKKVDCDHRNWCTWQLTPDVQDMYNFTLMAENKLRKRRTSILFNVIQRVHPKHAREIVVGNVGSTEAKLTWQIIPNQKNLSFLCQIEVFHDEKVKQYNSSDLEFTLRELKPYTTYSAQIRCGTANHFWKWSEWSSKNFTTKEAAPSGALDVWRTVKPVSGGYNVKIFWKPLPIFQANGKIQKYKIVMETLGKVPYIFYESNNSTEKKIDQQPYRISVEAINSAGSSTPSVIVVSGDTENSTQNIQEDRVDGTLDGITLSWKPSPRENEGYVIDWCNYPQEASCDFQWKKFSSNITSAVINSAAFHPGVRYNFKIYALSTKHEAYLLEKKTGYTQELPPDCKPEVTIDELASTSLRLTWTDNCTDEPQNGFFKGYHIYVTPEVGSCNLEAEKKDISDNLVACMYTILDTKQTTFYVKKLQPQSTYNFEVKAFSGGGDSKGRVFKATTAIHENSNLLMTIVFPMAFFFLLLFIIFNLKIKWLKEKCFPDIPDPYKSSVLSLMKFKGNIQIMNTSICIPDTIEVVNKSEISKTQESRTSLIGNEVTKPAYLYLLPTGKDPWDSQPCICFENFTYCQASSDSGSCSRDHMIPTDPTRAVDSPGHIPMIEKDYIGSLGNIPGREEIGLNYVSQLASTMSEDKRDSLSSNLPEPAQCSEYKMQMVVPTGLAPSLPPDGDRPISGTSLDQLEKPC